MALFLRIPVLVLSVLCKLIVKVSIISKLSKCDTVGESDKTHYSYLGRMTATAGDHDRVHDHDGMLTTTKREQ